MHEFLLLHHGFIRTLSFYLFMGHRQMSYFPHKAGILAFGLKVAAII